MKMMHVIAMNHDTVSVCPNSRLRTLGPSLLLTRSIHAADIDETSDVQRAPGTIFNGAAHSIAVQMLALGETHEQDLLPTSDRRCCSWCGAACAELRCATNSAKYQG